MNWQDEQKKVATGVTTPNTIQFNSEYSWVMRITADRRIEVNEGVEVTEAAQQVLDALQPLFALQSKREWVGLTEDDWVRIYSHADNSVGRAAELAEEILKEKNT